METAHKTFVGGIIAGIAHFGTEIATDVEGIFNSGEAAWKKLSPEIQADFTQGSQIFAIINKDLSQVPTFVIADIQKLIPGIDLEKVEAGLLSTAKQLNVIVQLTDTPDFETLIGDFQLYFKNFPTHNGWATAAKGAASLLIDAFQVAKGVSSPIEVIEELVQYAYQAIIKPAVVG